jgi:hypothetical protein
MSMGWGQAKQADLIEHSDAEEIEDAAVAALAPGEVAIVSGLGAIYGSPAELVALARKVVAKWGDD